MEESRFLEKLLSALSKIRGEISEKGGEFDFRYSLSNHLIGDAFGWSRKRGEGHFEVEKGKKDIILYDDSNPPFPVVVFETKKPSEALEIKHYEQLAGYLEGLGCAKYGILTNGHTLILYEYIQGRTQKKFELNLDEVSFKSVLELEEEAKKKLFALQLLARERFVKRGDAEYFKEHYKETPLKYIRGIEDIGYSLFITGLKGSLEELTEALAKFFDNFIVREDYSGEFLRKSFKDWEGWREFSGGKSEAKDIFCRETAYILLNRILFARICEDKTITDQRISGYRIANFLREHIEEKNPYLEALEDAYKGVERHYPHFYQLGIFDWWRLEKDKRALLSEDDLRKQEELEGELNFCLGAVLKRLNRFDFKEVNRDILGHVYEDYLSKEERKRLGEFYTPIEVVKYILDQVGFASEEKIEGKKLLDPACGSGTFLVEATNRLIERYLKKYRKIKVNNLPPDESRQVLESIIEAIYGFDINPFACHIAEINMLFHTIDLYDNVKQKFKDYMLRRFNIYNTDSLKLPGEKAKTTLEEFTRINGRAKAYANDIARIDEIKRKQFDFVVGNPPYVRTHKIPGKEAYEESYKDLIYGQYDLSYLFVGRGIQWLKTDGKFAYITSNKFCILDSGIKLRDYILNNCKIDQFIDFSGIQTFAEPLPSAAIIVLEKGKANENLIKVDIKTQKHVPDIYEIDTFEKALEYLLKNLNFYKVSQSRFYENKGHIFDFSLPDKLVPLAKKIESRSGPLIPDAVSDIKRGLRPDTSKFKDEFFIPAEKYEKLNEKEKRIYKKHIRGEDIVDKYNIRWQGEYVKFDDEKMAEGGNKELYETPKVVIKRIGKNLRASYDEENYYCYKTIHLIKASDSAVPLKYLTAILNSELIEFYFISKFYLSRLGRGSFEFREQFITHLPICLPQSPSEKSLADTIVEKVDYILSLMRRAGEFDARVAGFPEATGGDASLLNLMEEQNLNKDSYNLNALHIGKMRTLEGRDLYKLHLTKNDYIAFDSIDLAEYLQKLLSKRERITKAEFLSMKLPTREDIERQMREHRDDLKEAEKIKNEASELEGQIDEIVYKLYGLEDDDIAIIKEYLETY